MHSIFVSIQKPFVARGGDENSAVEAWLKAIGIVRNTIATPESFVELGEGCWLLRTENAAPILGSIVDATKFPRLDYKILVADNVTEWTCSFPKTKP